MGLLNHNLNQEKLSHHMTRLTSSREHLKIFRREKDTSRAVTLPSDMTPKIVISGGRGPSADQKSPEEEDCCLVLEHKKVHFLVQRQPRNK